MSSLWRDRYGENPASLLLLDAATYATNPVHDSKKETNYALKLFGESQKQMILDHLNKIAPLAREPVQPLEYHGDCLCILIPESTKVGATDWWTAHCPGMKTQPVDCRHHDLLNDTMIRLVGRIVNEHCIQMLRERELLRLWMKRMGK